MHNTCTATCTCTCACYKTKITLQYMLIYIYVRACIHTTWHCKKSGLSARFQMLNMYTRTHTSVLPWEDSRYSQGKTSCISLLQHAVSASLREERGNNAWGVATKALMWSQAPPPPPTTPHPPSIYLEAQSRSWTPPFVRKGYSRWALMAKSCSAHGARRHTKLGSDLSIWLHVWLPVKQSLVLIGQCDWVKLIIWLCPSCDLIGARKFFNTGSRIQSKFTRLFSLWEVGGGVWERDYNIHVLEALHESGSYDNHLMTWGEVDWWSGWLQYQHYSR